MKNLRLYTKIAAAVMTAAVLFTVLTGCGAGDKKDPDDTSVTAAADTAETGTPADTAAPADTGTAADTGNAGKPDKISFEPEVYRIQACGMYTYALSPDGKLLVSADIIYGENVVETYRDFESWTGVRNFSVNDEAVAAVLEDGTVLECGGLRDQLDGADFSKVPEWTDVVQVAMGKHDLLALRSDGSIELAGLSRTDELDDTTGFVQVEAGCAPMAVKADGTVKVWFWDWDDSVNEAESWTDIVSVSSTWNHIAALKSDGTVVACGNNDCGQCDVESWTDIVAVSAGVEYTLGLRSDGTVVACGSNENGKCEVGSWTDIVEIDAGYHHATGLRSDGTVVAAGANWQGQCNVSGWNLNR